MDLDSKWFWDEREFVESHIEDMTKPEWVLVIAALGMILSFLGAIAYLVVTL